MKKTLLFFVLCILALSLDATVFAKNSHSAPVNAKTAEAKNSNPTLLNKHSAVIARLIASTKAIVPGQSFKLGVELTMAPGWHTYYKEPGDAGMPTKIIWQLPPGFQTSSLHWEKPTKFEEAGITTYGYTNKTTIATEVTPPQNLSPTKTLNISGQVKWLSCKDICIPGGTEVHLALPVISQAKAKLSDLAANTKAFANIDFSNSADKQVKQNNNNIDLSDLPEQPRSSNSTQIFGYFIFAILGGFLLNFMPCVLPVVAIKILSLLEQTNKENTRKTVIAFSSGILSSFILLGILIVGLQAAGQKIGWGFQFQQPVFLMFMSGLVLLFAMSLLGLFEFSLNFGPQQKGLDNLAEQKGFVGDFFKGVLATILSTPCTAPFLGTALGFAFVEPWTVTLAIFAAVGMGMCLPYLVLIIAPQYLRFLPKPGDWMAKLKEAFGFIMLATVIWLLSILYYQIPATAVIAFMYFLLSLAFAIWLLNRFTNLASSAKRILIVRSIASIIVLSAAYIFIFQNKDLVLNSTSGDTSNTKSSANISDADTKAFDLNALNRALSTGKTVFLDFGAKWCLTCQLNENAVIDNPEIQKKFTALNVVFIKADWTKQDPTVTKLLRKFERSGVPFYVIFPGKNPNKPIILPEILTTQLVLNKLEQAGPSINK